MSVYPQSSTYTQMAYPPQGYGAPVPPPNAYYAAPPPAPQPVYQHFDPNTFRRDYSTRLSNLTVNSRPIIQSLSIIAQEYTRFADAVVQCIEQHIRRVSTVYLSYFIAKWLAMSMQLIHWGGQGSVGSYMVSDCTVVSSSARAKQPPRERRRLLPGRLASRGRHRSCSAPCGTDTACYGFRSCILPLVPICHTAEC